MILKGNFHIKLELLDSRSKDCGNDSKKYSLYIIVMPEGLCRASRIFILFRILYLRP